MSEFQKNIIMHKASYRSHFYSFDAKYVNYTNMKSKNQKNETQKHKSPALSEFILIKNHSLVLVEPKHWQNALISSEIW